MTKTLNREWNKRGGFLPLLIIIIVAAAVVVGGGVVIYKKSHPSQPVMNANVEATSTTSVNTNVNANVNLSAQASIKDLLAAGRSVKCTFIQNATSSNTTGTIFVASGKVRGDFDSQTSAGAMRSHMISDGTNVNFWTDSSTQGFKMKMDASASAQTRTNTPDLAMKLNYSCEPWTANSSEFTPPTNITFSDMNALVPKMNVPAGVKVKLNADGTVETY